jgi:Flp pilus assembly pilin Flp
MWRNPPQFRPKFRKNVASFVLPREDERVLTYFNRFLSEEHGAISVDYTVLSAAAVSMAIATTAIVTGGIDNLTQRIDTELRERQLNDTFIDFESAHFEPLYMAGLLSEEAAGDLWNDRQQRR